MTRIIFDIDNLKNSLTPLLDWKGSGNDFERAFVIVRKDHTVSTFTEESRFTIDDLGNYQTAFPVPPNAIGSDLHSLLTSELFINYLDDLFGKDSDYSIQATKELQDAINTVKIANIFYVDDYLNDELELHWPDGPLDEAISNFEERIESLKIAVYGDIKGAFLDMADGSFLDDEVDCLEDDHVQALLENGRISQLQVDSRCKTHEEELKDQNDRN